MNQNGRVLRGPADNNGYDIATLRQPTFYRPGSTPDTVDIAIIINIQLQYDLKVKKTCPRPQPNVFGSRKDGEENLRFKKSTNWFKFARYLELNHSGIKAIYSTADLEQVVQTIENDVNSAISAATTTCTEQIKPAYDIPRELYVRSQGPRSGHNSRGVQQAQQFTTTSSTKSNIGCTFSETNDGRIK